MEESPILGLKEVWLVAILHGPVIMSYPLFFLIMPPKYFRLLPLSLTEHVQCPSCSLTTYSGLPQLFIFNNWFYIFIFSVVLTGKYTSFFQNWHRALDILFLWCPSWHLTAPQVLGHPGQQQPSAVAIVQEEAFHFVYQSSSFIVC